MTDRLHLVPGVGASDGPGTDTGSTGEPEQPGAVPACPDTASEAVRAVWDALAPTLPNPLAPVDVHAFRMLCTAIVTFHEADDLISASGIVISDAHGNLVENPVLKIRDRADGQVSKWAVKFGLTPADRPRNSAPSGGQQGPRPVPHLVEQ